MQCNGNTHGHVADYVDDLLCTMKDLRRFLNHLIYKYKLKGNEPLSFLLGCDFGCDPIGTHYIKLKKYTSKTLGSYECMFQGETLEKQSSPILKGDHPELDASEFVSKEDKAKYMSMISTAYACHTWKI